MNVLDFDFNLLFALKLVLNSMTSLRQGIHLLSHALRCYFIGICAHCAPMHNIIWISFT